MKRKSIYTILLLVLMSMGTACSTDDSNEPVGEEPGENPGEVPSQDYEALDLAALDNGQGVMMQAFYWDVEPRHQWWELLEDKVADWAATGVDRIWLPVATKGQSGGYSMGYDPSDYFDFGEYHQHGTTPTRFGTREELESLIAKAQGLGMEVIADIVLNHNSGGGSQYNPYREKDTYTLFDQDNGNASGKFNRNYEHYHPNSIHEHDPEAMFYEEQDVCHDHPYVQQWLWEGEESVARYYKEVMGFDGWRFDYVKGFEPWVIRQWMETVGGFAVGEMWEGNAEVLVDWVEAAGIPAFDFAAFYKMEEAFDRYNDLNYLSRDMLRKTHPDKAVTFVANHDTEKDEHQDNRIARENKMKSYAYILTHDGYPTIFYLDYEDQDFQEELKQLIRIHNSLAIGEVEVLYVDKDEYVMRRMGTGNNPGLVLYINTSNGTKRRAVNTLWNDQPVMDYSGNTSYSTMTDETGRVYLEAPANGYAIYSIME